MFPIASFIDFDFTAAGVKCRVAAIKRFLVFYHSAICFLFEPAHDKTYNKTCVTSEDSDQPAHPCSLIRVFADCMSLLQSPDYPKRGKSGPLNYRVDVQADLSLCWSHRSYCRFYRALAQFFPCDLCAHSSILANRVPLKALLEAHAALQITML